MEVAGWQKATVPGCSNKHEGWANSCIGKFWVEAHDEVAGIAAGVHEIHGVPSGLTKYEEDAIKAAIPELKSSIDKGIDFARQNS